MQAFRERNAERVGNTDIEIADERSAFAPAALSTVGWQDHPRQPVRSGVPRLVEAAQPRPSWRVSLRDTAAADLEREVERGGAFLTIPVFFGAGAAAYFSLPFDPPAFWLVLSVIILAACVHGMRARIAARFLVASALVAALGMTAAAFETWRAGTSMLGADISTRIIGHLVRIEDRPNGRVRLTIDVLRTERPELRYAPERIRATARTVPPGLLPGQAVAGVVRLLPPTGPARPWGYDFSFESYFDGVGASGFFLAGPFAAEPAKPPDVGLAAWIEQVRMALASRIRGHVAGPEGEIAAALVAGVRGGIPEPVNEALRVTGLAHILSISGLHMALVAATFLGAARLGFALFPGFASRRPVKKYAAVIGLGAITLYLVISGAEVAAQRSYIMFAVMLLAVLFDRAALTMRNLAISALIVLAISPHEVMGPSFQMSFAATAALIAAYGWYGERRATRMSGVVAGERSGIVRLTVKALLVIGGLAMTSIIAGLATGLFGVWHFQRISAMSLPANLAVAPLVSFVVMPFAVVGTLLIPLGLDGLFFKIMGYGLSGMLAIADWLAARSPIDAVGMIPVSALIALSLALALATIATTRLRLLALTFLAAGVLLVVTRDLPDVMVSEDARLVALRLEGGGLAVNRARPSSFTVGNWLSALDATAIVKPAERTLDPAELSPGGGFVCDGGLCMARTARGMVVAHAKDAASAIGACNVAALLVIEDATAVRVCGNKAAQPTTVTGKDLARHGSLSVRLAGAGAPPLLTYAIESAKRPWHNQRRFSRAARGLAPYRRGESKTPSRARSGASGSHAVEAAMPPSKKPAVNNGG